MSRPLAAAERSPFAVFGVLAIYAGPAAYLLLTTMFGARIFLNLPFDVVRVGLWGTLLITLGYGVLAVLRRHFGVAAAAGALILYVLLAHLMFAGISGSPPDFNALASYLPVLAFVVFCETRASIPRVLGIFVAIAAIYLVIYIAGYSYFLAADADAQLGSAVLPGNVERAARVYLLGAWASFAAFYGLYARGRPWWLRVALVAAGSWAIWLSGSRTFGALYVAFFALGLIGRTGRWTRAAIFGAVVAISLLLFAGLLLPRWNPFELMPWDSSAAYRAVEYRRSLIGIMDHWVLGVGLPGEPMTLTQYLKAPRAQLLFPSDLGAVGMMLMLGLPGLAIFFAVVWFCTIGTAQRYAAPSISALQLNALLCASIAWLSPMLIVEPVTIFLALLIAIHVRKRRTRPAGPSPHVGEGVLLPQARPAS